MLLHGYTNAGMGRPAWRIAQLLTCWPPSRPPADLIKLDLLPDVFRVRMQDDIADRVPGGAVRKSRGPASCDTPSASPTPFLDQESENMFAVTSSRGDVEVSLWERGGGENAHRACELSTSPPDGQRPSRRARRWRRRREVALEIGEVLDRGRARQSAGGLQVLHVVGHARVVAIRVLLPLVLKELTGDAHLDVVGLAREYEKRDVWGLPTEARIVRSCGSVATPEIVRAGTAIRSPAFPRCFRGVFAQMARRSSPRFVRPGRRRNRGRIRKTRAVPEVRWESAV